MLHRSMHYIGSPPFNFNSNAAEQQNKRAAILSACPSAPPAARSHTRLLEPNDLGQLLEKSAAKRRLGSLGQTAQNDYYRFTARGVADLRLISRGPFEGTTDAQRSLISASKPPGTVRRCETACRPRDRDARSPTGNVSARRQPEQDENFEETLRLQFRLLDSRVVTVALSASREWSSRSLASNKMLA